MSDKRHIHGTRCFCTFAMRMNCFTLKHVAHSRKLYCSCSLSDCFPTRLTQRITRLTCSGVTGCSRLSPLSKHWFGRNSDIYHYYFSTSLKHYLLSYHSSQADFVVQCLRWHITQPVHLSWTHGHRTISGVVISDLMQFIPCPTYSMVQSPSWEASQFSASYEIPHILWNPKVHYHIHRSPPPVPILS